MTDQKNSPENSKRDDKRNNTGNNHIGKNIGKSMIVVAWILVIGFLTLFFGKILDQQRNPNQNISNNQSNTPASEQSNKNVRIVTLKRNRFGHYIATGIINNQSVELILDTGATDVSIPANLAAKLNLKKGSPRKTITANGTIVTYSTILKEVKLGDIVLRNVRASINPHSNDVLLGMSFLKHLEFTQKGNTLTLKQSL